MFDSWKRVPLCMLISRNVAVFACISYVNLILGWKLLRSVRNFSSLSLPCVKDPYMSSMYHSQVSGLYVCMLRKACSSLCIKIVAKAGAILVPIAVPHVF